MPERSKCESTGAEQVNVPEVQVEEEKSDAKARRKASYGSPRHKPECRLGKPRVKSGGVLSQNGYGYIYIYM